jgi:hypothetical protein
MDTFTGSLSWLVVLLVVFAAVALVALGLLVWWLKHPVEDEVSRDQ